MYFIFIFSSSVVFKKVKDLRLFYLFWFKFVLILYHTLTQNI